MLTVSERKLLHALRRRKIREAEQLFLAEGVRVVEELVGSGIDLRLSVAAPSLEDTDRGRALAARLEETGRLRRLEQRAFEALTVTESPQGVLAVGRIPHHGLPFIQVAERSTVVVLDAVQDPGNFGTVVRCADAFGATLVATLPGTVDPWNPKSVRAAAGSSFHLPIVQVAANELLEWLGAEGFVVYGADAAGTAMESAPPAQRVALVLGNEGAGLGPEMRAAAAALVAVPIRGAAESLNVGVAAGILLYLLSRSL